MLEPDPRSEGVDLVVDRLQLLEPGVGLDPDAQHVQRRLLVVGLRVDGIISDYPDRLRTAMQGKNIPLPPAVTPR